MSEIVSSESAVLVHIQFSDTDFSEDLDEFIELVNSSGIETSDIISIVRHTPDPRFFIGSGKVAEIKSLLAVTGADLVIFNNAITPGQERNLEKELQCRVIDRVGLILDIFAQRARSYEGKLQVELAQLQHMSTRLIRGWTHLERQKGGIGLRGPGETQLETDRRLIGKRIKTITSRLDKVRSQRQQGRKQRHHAEIPVISLVGYTNAGKSTLFNTLAGTDVYSADKLFATLDPILRRVEIAPNVFVIITDTVGFIRHIPHGLIEAFNATLEETRDSDLLLHIVDVNDQYRHEHIQQVNQVIDEIGALDVPQIEVYNKIDKQNDMKPRYEKNRQGEISRIWLSAKSGQGIDILKPASKLRARLFDIGAVYREESTNKGGWIMEVDIGTQQLSQLCIESGIEDSMLQLSPLSP